MANTEYLIFDINPKSRHIVPKYPEQWSDLGGGKIRVWYTQAQLDDVKMMIDEIREGKSNLFEEEKDAVEYELPVY